MDLQTIVNAHQHHLSNTEREILAFMLTHEEFVAESTINSLAHRTYTSTSSIIRLTKKLNFSGFTELKYFIKNSLNTASERPVDFVSSGVEDIMKTLETLQNTDLEEILNHIHRARTVYCFGTGYAQRNAIQEFSKSLLVCGKFAHVIPAKNEFAGSISSMTTDDLVIVVSLSGNTESVQETIKALSSRKIPMLAITAQSLNYISSHATYSLRYEATPTHVGDHSKHPYHSFVALSVLLDYIVRQYMNFLDTEDQ
ncbi:MurR/RpiR family transcriptional regulator [Rothia sp. CCM 9418]|uniref:MurR/RpiR family transcriptional regulator n=1 Tax=unclassified Rothia (in: high G+C Gram-positive bacteria) TaxID=2689056 RepID=UPI003AD6AD42